jgi:hypothetical protein
MSNIIRFPEDEDERQERDNAEREWRKPSRAITPEEFADYLAQFDAKGISLGLKDAD